MRKEKNLIALLLIVVSLLAQGIVSVSANTPSTLIRDVDDNGWRTIETDVITVFFPADGRKPMFLWWYNKEPSNIYVVKFDGLIEYFTFNTTYYRHRFNANDLTFQELFDEEIEHDHEDHENGLFQLEQGIHLYRLRERLEELREVVEDITRGWGHPAYLPFNGCKWTLQNVNNITADDSNIIGLTFSFNLTRAPLRFKFAENNVAINVRFYYVPVTENVDSLYTYKVGANEIKMDFIVKNWKWNLNLVQPLLESLRNYGVKVPQTNTGLALSIHLASINATKLDDVEDDEFEVHATTPRMLIENFAVGLSKDKFDDDESPIMIAKEFKDNFKLKFASDNQTLAGFFKFIASAMVKNSSGTYQVPVKAAYGACGASLKLFISYPYFNGTLIHDPSIGVETRETTAPSATTPIYQVTVGSTMMAAPSAHLIAPQILSTQLVILLVVAATVITLALFMMRSRGRAIVLRSL